MEKKRSRRIRAGFDYVSITVLSGYSSPARNNIRLLFANSCSKIKFPHLCIFDAEGREFRIRHVPEVGFDDT